MVRITECGREASKMRRLWPSRGCCAMGEKNEFPSVCSLLFCFAAVPTAVTYSLHRMNYHVSAHAWDEQNNELIIVKHIK